MHLVLFRFFFLYFMLTTTPWLWFFQIPGVPWLGKIYGSADQWVVEKFNTHILHVKNNLNYDGGGSGDTSAAWASYFTYLILALAGCLIWTLLDRKRADYGIVEVILRNVVRFFVCMVAFSYGIIKLFALQMPFPNLNQLATPLGDFLPMRLSWMFMGYSFTYQVFTGIMEIIVGILLLNRKTITLGALMGVAVFTHVFLLNMSYDIPVKLNSMQLVIACFYLAAFEWKRLLDFFYLHKPPGPAVNYDLGLNREWQWIARVLLKIGFIALVVIMPFIVSRKRYIEVTNMKDVAPIKSGVYNINLFVQNTDTLNLPLTDDMNWKDFIFDKEHIGSVNTLDTMFMQRYRRGYFFYTPDTVSHVIAFRKSRMARYNLFEMQYKIIDDKTIAMWGTVRDDSLYIELERSDRHFQLAEKQFHWISEANR